MFTATPAQPCESGRRDNHHPQNAGTHITSAVSSQLTPSNHRSLANAPQQIVINRDNAASTTPSANSSLKTHHSSLGASPRNIRSSSGWLWQDKSALRVIGAAFSGDRLRAARSIYLALTEIASGQFTPSRAHTSCAYLGSLAGCSESSARRYLREFVRLGLIAVEYGVHAANTYILLGETRPADGLAEAEMELADGAGKSSLCSDGGTQRGIAPGSSMAAGRVMLQASASVPGEGVGVPAYQQASTAGPRRASNRTVSSDAQGLVAARPAGKSGGRRAVTGDSPMQVGAGDRGSSVAEVRAVRGDTPRGGATGGPGRRRAVTPDSQGIRIQDSRIRNQQPDRVVGAAPALVDIRAENTANSQPGSLLRIAAGEIALNDEQAASVQALTGIGVRRRVAEEIAATHSPDTVYGWVRYAKLAAGLKSRAGFVLAMLKAGEESPAPFPHYQPVGYAAPPATSLALSPTPAYATPPGGAMETDDTTGEDKLVELTISRQARDVHQNTSSPSSAQLEPSWRLTAASAEEDSMGGCGEPASHAEAFTSAPHDYDLALWQVVREELQRRVPGSAWSLWLQHVRLISADRTTVRLSRPAVGVTEMFERRYGSELQEVLTEVAGRAIELEFLHGQLGPPWPVVTTCQRC